METNTYVSLALLAALVWFLYIQLYNWRFKKFSHIPQHYPNTLLLGGGPTIGRAFKRLGDKRRHPDYAFDLLWRESGYPQFNFYDIRPFTPSPMVVVASHDIAEQITKVSKIHPWSVTKSPTMSELFDLIGPKSMLSADGLTWKTLRKRFNPGFAPQQLLTLLPTIIQKSNIFMKRLDALAESGAETEMEVLCTELTFDIIGEVVCNIDLQAQDETGGHEVVYQIRELLKTYIDDGALPIWLNVPNRFRRIYYSKKADASIKRVIKDKFADIKAAQSEGTKQSQNRSVLALALKDVDVLTSEDLHVTADQIKSFFFAGHDTTSTLLQRLFYHLSIDPKRLQALRAEHDAVFGDADPREVFLARPDETIKGLTYTSACIKEILRLFPPAGSARLSVRGKGFTVRLEDGQELCLDDTILYINHFLIHRDPKVYGETADEFVPERWVSDTDTTATKQDDAPGAKKVPISAWRPFERGPKNCIGQELANIEARVILACVIRRYDFVKVGHAAVVVDEKGRPVVGEDGRYKTNGELFNAQVLTAKPFDKCRMTVKLHEAEN
ncbi:cytochrome P450 [Byssothecium circinans]|uniref:Cytochrome P450 n=1 Tax=Byssothecium circinans TaxID=147558 RepID=A0A6A5TF19_9PLEO|nr:cytochrome P450 [Byssothecium circinans]